MDQEFMVPNFWLGNLVSIGRPKPDADVETT